MQYRLVFYKDNTILGKLIKWFTKSEYCHVGILINTNTLFDIDKGRTSRLSPFEYDENKHDIYELCGKVDDNLATNFIYSHLDKKYDMGEILKIILNLKNIADIDDKWICSTLVFDFIKECTDIEINTKIKIVTPQDLVETGKIYKG